MAEVLNYLQSIFPYIFAFASLGLCFGVLMRSNRAESAKNRTAIEEIRDNQREITGTLKRVKVSLDHIESQLQKIETQGSRVISYLIK